MTLYETIFTRRQVRNYLNSPVPKDRFDHILAFVSEAEQLASQCADFKLLPAAEVSANQGASHYLLAFCDNSPSAYANVGFMLQKADLYVQSMGLGTGISRLILKKKLNKIDAGIAACHAVLALEHDGKTAISAIPKSNDGKFHIEITYKEKTK